MYSYRILIAKNTYSNSMDFVVNHLMADTKYTVIGSECESKVQFIEFVTSTKPNGE